MRYVLTLANECMEITPWNDGTFSVSGDRYEFGEHEFHGRAWADDGKTRLTVFEVSRHNGLLYVMEKPAVDSDFSGIYTGEVKSAYYQGPKVIGRNGSYIASVTKKNPVNPDGVRVSARLKRID